MARTRDVLTGVGQAGAQIGEALLKVAMMREDRSKTATSNALNMVQLDQAERRIDQDAEQMASAALRHDETTAFNLTQATEATSTRVMAMIERGWVPPEGMAHAEIVKRVRNGENPGKFEDWADSIEGEAHQQRLDMETAEALKRAAELTLRGYGSGGVPFPAGSLSERAKLELAREYIKMHGRTFRSANHPDVISGALESEEEAARQWVSEVGMANLTPFEQEMARQMSLRFLERGGEEGDLFNLTPDSVQPPDSANFRSNDDSLSGTATEQREGAGDPVLLPTDTAGAQPDPQEVDTLTAAFNPNAEADSAFENDLREDALRLMGMDPSSLMREGAPEVVNMNLEQVMDWLRERPSGTN